MSDEHDLPTSEEQTYRDMMRGIQSFMGWSHVPDIDSSNSSDDNPFAGPKTLAPSKVSVQMPTEEWLCKKLSKLNINLVEGYLSRIAEAGSLPMDHLLKVQKDMQTQLRTVHNKSKGKGSSKASEATVELQFLMEFNSSIIQAAAKVMEHLIDFVFIAMGNLTLACRDAYLNHVKNGIKPDTLAALGTTPLHISTLSPDAVIKRAEEEITYYDNTGQSTSSSSHHKGQFHPYEGLIREQRVGWTLSRRDLPGKTLGGVSFDEVEARTLIFHHDLPEGPAVIQITITV